MTFPTPRPKARPGKSAGLPKPNMNLKRYPGFVLEELQATKAAA